MRNGSKLASALRRSVWFLMPLAVQPLVIVTYAMTAGHPHFYYLQQPYTWVVGPLAAIDVLAFGGNAGDLVSFVVPGSFLLYLVYALALNVACSRSHKCLVGALGFIVMVHAGVAVVGSILAY